MRELICRMAGDDADIDDAYDQLRARLVNMTMARIGTGGESTSYIRVDDESGNLVRMSHVDDFGIVRDGEPEAGDPYPQWIQPTGAHDSYPVLRLDGAPTRVMHNDVAWQNTSDTLNSWEPGVFGWTEVTEL